MISIHSPHARGDLMPSRYAVIISISIHSPHARGDNSSDLQLTDSSISIHSPHARGDNMYCARRLNTIFQSTPLMRGETRAAKTHICADVYFNPLPSCEGRPPPVAGLSLTPEFQSTPLMRGETNLHAVFVRVGRFQSTPLMRGETISRKKSCHVRPNFNPLPSCEGRP